MTKNRSHDYNQGQGQGHLDHVTTHRTRDGCLLMGVDFLLKLQYLEFSQK